MKRTTMETALNRAKFVVLYMILLLMYRKAYPGMEQGNIADALVVCQVISGYVVFGVKRGIMELVSPSTTLPLLLVAWRFVRFSVGLNE